MMMGLSLGSCFCYFYFFCSFYCLFFFRPSCTHVSCFLLLLLRP